MEKYMRFNMTDHDDLSELTEMIMLGLREQAMHPQGLNSSQTNGTLYPTGDPRNKKPYSREECLTLPAIGSSKPLRTRAGSRLN
jgi:hypothetical protein